MQKQVFLSVALGVATSMASGCSDGRDEADLRTTALRLPYTAANGEQPNGLKSNGLKSNGLKSNGLKSNGLGVNKTITNLVVEATETAPPTLKGFVLEDNLDISGADFVGATIRARYSNGAEDQVVVTDYSNTLVPGMDLYLVIAKSDNEPICGYDSSNNPIWASVMPDVFNVNDGSEANDPTLFTFACRFAALEKCNEYGYPKSKSINEYNGTSRRKRMLTDYHAACVRMVRADYCGDGVGHTFNGTSIDIYDHLEGNNTPSNTVGSAGWEFEAGWADDGAHCIGKTRWMPSALTTLAENRSSANPDYEYIRTHCPERFAFPVPKVGGGMSVPDRACSTSSNFNTSVGFNMYPSGSARQPGRIVIENLSNIGYRY